MRKATTLVLALVFALATMAVVADDVLARGGGSGGSGSGGSAGPGPGVSGGAAGGGAGDAGGGGDAEDRTPLEEGALAFPRAGVIVTGCTTTNFGAAGGTTPCPVNR